MTDRNGSFVYLPLGGAGEIGMNCYLYGFGPAADRRWLMVDCGIGFGDMDTAPGVELVLPDISFLDEEKGGLEAIVLTHAHEDHVGAIAHLWDRLGVPILARPFTAEVVRRKFDEAGLGEPPLHVVGPGDRTRFGPFDLEFLPITHSIPEASSVAIRTPAGTAVHTGDFKLDPEPLMGQAADLGPFRALGEEGVLALACDSTNVFLPGRAGSEAEIVPHLERVLAECQGAVAATSFASNVSRLRTLATTAEAAGRSIVIAGRAMRRMIEIAVETGILTDFPSVVPDDRARDIPAANLFYLVTGSQGEGRAALARIAQGSHPTVTLGAGDTVLFSSKTIPGNEASIYRLYNKFSEMGVRVIDSEQARIHVSGHARQEDLADIYAALRPRIAVPMHGEHRHLVEHARLAPGWNANQAFIVPNGTMLRLDGNDPRIEDHVETGRIYLDGHTQVGALDGVIRERLKLARDGQVSISVVIDEEGELIADPQVKCLGAPKDGPGWTAPLDEMISEAVDDALEEAPSKQKRSDGAVEDVVSRAARRVIGRHWGKKPVLSVLVTRLED